jgi:hypothetical protein
MLPITGYNGSDFGDGDLLNSSVLTNKAVWTIQSERASTILNMALAGKGGNWIPFSEGTQTVSGIGHADRGNAALCSARPFGGTRCVLRCGTVASNLILL